MSIGNTKKFIFQSQFSVFSLNIFDHFSEPSFLYEQYSSLVFSECQELNLVKIFRTDLLYKYTSILTKTHVVKMQYCLNHVFVFHLIIVLSITGKAAGPSGF